MTEMNSKLKTEKPPIWTKNFILLWIAGMFLATSYYVMLPVLPLYADSINLSATDIGVLVAVYTFSALLIRPMAGYIVDNYGRRMSYLLAVFIYSLLMGGYALVATMMGLILVRFIHGLSWGIYTTAGSTVSADLLPQERRGEGVGYYMLTLSIAMAVGPAVSLKLIDAGYGYDLLFYGALGLGLLGLTSAMFIRFPLVRGEKSKISWKNLFEKSVLQLSITMFFISITYATVITFIPLYGIEVGLDASATFFLVYAIIVAVVRPFSGRYLDRHGPKWIVSLSLLVMGVGYLYMYFVPTVFAFGVGALLIGFGSGIALPALSATVANRVPAEKRGRANGTFFTSLDLGIGLGSLLLGVLADMVNVAATFGASAFISWLGMLYFWFFVIKKDAHLPYATTN